jgi:hypothetical protein
MSELDAFLDTGKQPAAPTDAAPAPAPAAEPPPSAPAAKPDTAKADAPKAAPDPPPPDPDEDIGHDGGMIPASTFHKARTDWKTKTVEAQTEARILREQVEAFKKQSAAPPPQPQQQQPPPEPLDPVRDPVGYHNRLQSVLLNDRLNLSEMLEREKHPPEAFEAAVVEFQQAAAQQPDLYSKLHSQRHPYGWLMKEVEKLRLTRELGDDPAAFRAKIAAEERAKWEQEQGNGAAPVSPAAGLPPSLATTRSAAPRSANAFSGPPALDDIFRREPKRR